MNDACQGQNYDVNLSYKPLYGFVLGSLLVGL